MEMLTSIFSKIFLSIKQTVDIAQQSSMLAELSNLALRDTNLNAFETYLVEQFGLSSKLIHRILNQFVSNAECKGIIGRKLLILWIKYKLFDTMNIFKRSQQAKRKKITQYLQTCDFYNISLKDLIIKCFNITGQQLQQSDIPQYQLMIMEGRNPDDLKIIFSTSIPLSDSQINQQTLPDSSQATYDPDKSINQALDDMMLDYQCFPKGSLESEVQRELLISYLKRYKDECSLSNGAISELKQANNDIKRLQQNFTKYFGILPSEISNIFKELLQNGQAYEDLCALKSKIMPINVLQLQRLINKTNKARALIKHKEVIFVLGTTGSGKSTNILRFLGYTLKIAKFKKLLTLTPVEQLAKEHSTFYTSPEAKSCTRYINSAPIPDQMYKKGTRQNKKNLFICDSPGFGDNAGVEVDIANGVGMINALHGAASVRVVVLLEYNALLSNRMRGAIEIGEIISNLFYDLSQVLQSLVFLFNKFPKAQISSINHYIRSKIYYLTQIQKSNQKLRIFLEMLQQQSRQYSHYIYPLQSDYRSIFHQITSLPAITEVKQNFLYEFTASTKKQITNYVHLEKSKVKDLFLNNLYVEAKFHLQMLQKMKSILYADEKVQEIYAQVCKFIQQKSKYYYTQFENILVDIENGVENPKIKVELRESKEKVVQISKYFCNFTGLTIISQQQIGKLIDQYKQKLKRKANDLNNLNRRYRKALQIFSQQLSSELNKKVVQILGTSLQREVKQLRYLCDESNYQQMQQGIKKSKIYNEFISSISPNHPSLQQFKIFKQKVKNNAMLYLQFLTETTEQNKSILTPRIISESKQKLSKLKVINSYKIIGQEINLKQGLFEYNKAMVAKCRKYIREIQNISFSIEFEESSNKKSTDEKILAAKKNQIQLIMGISNVKEVLEKDFTYAKESIARKLKQNVEILNECINGLRSRKYEEIDKNINQIKRASDIVIRCSELVDNADSCRQIAQSITKEFLIYISRQMQIIKNIDIRLNLISSQTLKNLEQQYKNNDNYSKMASINPQIEKAVNEIKRQFNKVLMNPFVYFNDKQLPYLQQKQHYRSMVYFLEKFDKLCYYALELEEFLDKDEYSVIAEVQNVVLKRLQPYLMKMRYEFEAFIDLENIDQQPQYLRDLLKTMLPMSQKHYICKYISKHIQFSVVQGLNLILKQLENIKEKIEQKFKNIHNEVDKIQIIQGLMKICKFYSLIEDFFKNKQVVDKIGFKELQKRIGAAYNDSIKDDEERVKFLIESSKPSTMPWQQIKNIYEKFINLNNNQGKRKRDVILKEMYKIQAFILNELKRYNNQINESSQIIFNNRDRMNDFLDIFKEALELQKNLNNLYCQIDKKRININKKHLREVGSNIIEIFSTQFDNIRRQLTDYNIININKKINSFGNLELIIQNVFINEMQEQAEQNKEISQKIVKFIEGKRRFMLDEIAAFQQMHPSQSYQLGKVSNTKRLKDLFLKYKGLIEEQIKEKYQSSAQKLQLDNKFIRYYQHLKSSADPIIIEIKQQIINNIELYFKELLQSYKQKSQQSAEQSENIAKKIKQGIDNLPIDLKIIHNRQFQKLISEIKLQNDDLIVKLSSKISTNPAQIDSYIQKAHKAKINGQKALHKKLIDKLDQVLQNKSNIYTKISEKNNFIQEYFIKASIRNKYYLEEDQDMSKKMKSRLKNQLQKFKRQIQTEIGVIKKQFQNFNKAQYSEELRREAITQIFKIFSIICELSEQHQQFKTQFFSQFASSLSEIVNLFNQKANSRPIQNLLSKDTFDSALIIKFQNYLQYIIMNGSTLTLLRCEILNSAHSNYLNDVIKKYTNVQPQNYLNYYKQQVIFMLQEADINELCNDKQRNMNNKQLQAYFINLDKSFEILLENESLFNQYILLNKGKYSAKAMYERFERLFDILVNESINQVQDTFKDYNREPAVKINLTIDILRIMKEKKLKFIQKQKVNQKLMELQKLLKTKFQATKSACIQKMQVAKKIFNNVQDQIKVQQKKKLIQVFHVKQQTHQKIQSKSKEISEKYTQKINNETEQNKKKDLQKAKKTDIASYSNEYISQCHSLIQKIQAKFKSLVQKLRDDSEKPVKQFTDYLILFKKAVLDVKHENQKNSMNLEIIMNQIPKMGPKFIKIVECSLNQNSNDNQSIGKVILTTNKVFSNYVTNMINRLVQGRDIDYVVQNLKKINMTGREELKPHLKNDIINCYGQFKKKYEELKNIYKMNPSQSTIIQISIQCRDIGKQLKHDFYQSKRPIIGHKFQLLAGIFALWAILKSEKFEQEVQFTMQPHPTQIVTLLLLLGIVNQRQILDHRLAQVGTGEGKSVVLAGLSSYLALTGFKVRCACYSAYLSGRDQASFRPLFERLGVENEIKYGTFNQLCQDILNSDGNNFKDEVYKMILAKPKGLPEKAPNLFGKNLKINREPHQISANPTILVIDEVDVFFQDSFFGNSYCPAIKLKDSTVSNFLQYVFNEVTRLGENVDVSVLIKSKQFEQLLQKYPSLRELLINQVHGMVSGALSYKHDYFLIDKKIVYKDNDSIATNISYGYKTVFANIFQHQRNNVSRDNLEDALQIGLMIAQFSYAMLPKYFQTILGVTGTLQVLPQYKKRELMYRYKINDQYAIPSAFGIHNRRIDNYLVVPDAYIHKEIVERIKLIQDRRPIIIFFSSSRQLNQFFLSSAFEPYQKRTSNLTEEHQASVRDARIIRAVNHNVITLMTNSFGRGTDFVLLDQDIKDRGGLHVIHCFLSLDESQQVQIKGRTARQSNKGSYDAVISQNWLQQLSLKADQIPKNASPDIIHSILLKAREKRIDNLAKTTLKLLDQADKKHEQVIRIYSQQQLVQKDLIRYVFKLNNYPEIRKTNIKTVLGIDATGSMSGALKKTCEICSVSFERAYQVLIKENVKASIQIKIMIYRNYNSPHHEILQSTAYQNTPHNLKKFLERAVAKMGWCYEEAMEVMFQAANKDDQLDQVIVIGDAPANTLDGIAQARKILGQNYWNTNGFPYTNVDIEVNKFKAKKIPVHGFYLAAAGPAFTKITQDTGGKVAPFNLNSPKVSDELTSFIVEQILYLIEVKEGKPGLKLVQSYRKMFT